MLTLSYDGEQFTQIPMCPDYYLSLSGRVYSSFVNRVLKTYLTKGYSCVKLYDKSHLIHRLLAHTFLNLTNLYDGTLEVDHINTDTYDNKIENLQVLTVREHKDKSSIDNGLNIRPEKQYCLLCGANIHLTSTHCVKCTQKARGSVTSSMSEEDIESLLSQYKSWVKAAESLGISDNALRKAYVRNSGGKDPKLLKKKLNL